MADDGTTERIRILLDLETEAHDRAAKKSAREVIRLEKQYDPLSRAVVKLEREERKLADALEAGTIDRARYNELLERSQAQYKRTAAAIDGANGMMMRQQAEARGLTGALQRNGTAVQQLGYQVGDAAVQIGAGTNAMIAISQQGSQMLGIMGPMGAVLGAVLAITAPLAAGFFSMGDGGSAAAEAAEELQSAVDRYSAAAARAEMSTADLRQEYGEAAEAARELFAAQVQLEKLEVMQRLGEVQSEIAGKFGDMAGKTRADFEMTGRALDRLVARLQELRDGAEPVSVTEGRDIQASINALGDYADIIERIKRDLDLGTEEAGQFAGALADLANADGLEARSEALREVAQLYIEALATAEDVTAEELAQAQAMADAAQAGLDLTSALDGAASAAGGVADEAARIASNLGIAVSEALSLMNARSAKEYSGRGGDPRDFMEGGSRADYEADDEYTPVEDVAADLRARMQRDRKRRSGGGGRSRKKDPFDPLEKGRDEITKIEQRIDLIGKTEARVAALTYKWQALAAAKEKDVDLDRTMAETGRTVREEIEAQSAEIERLTQEYESAAERAEFFDSIQSTLKNGLIDAALEGENFADVLGNVAKMLAKAAFQAALFGEGPLSGGGGGGLLGAIFGGFRAAGGPVSAGKSYIVGENGPELFTPPSGGQIVPNHELGGAGGGVSVTYAPTIDARGADAAAVARLEEGQRRMAAEFEANTVSAVRKAQQRRLL